MLSNRSRRPDHGRWSVRHDAVRALRTNYSSIIKTLNILKNDDEQIPDIRADAKDIMKKCYALENVIMCHMWCDILERIDKVNKLLQSEGLVLKTVSESFVSLVAYINVIRNEFDSYEAAAIETLNSMATTTDGQEHLYA